MNGSIVQIARPLEVLDLCPPVGDTCRQVLEGLREPQKRLPSRLLYDERGSILFDRICLLDEYYLTRTELGILRRSAAEMAELLGDGCLLVDLGCGSGIKTRILLDALESPAGYVPVDISRAALVRSARRFSTDYPEVPVFPVCADYTEDFALPAPRTEPRRTVFFFPGSTIGNLDPGETVAFLRRLRRMAGPAGVLLVGVDLKKDPRLLHAAYNDASGVTAAFNSNVLERINRELAGEFLADQFAHYAAYNPARGRVEMHLVSLEDQVVGVADEYFEFRRGESIHTESSYKYRPEEFEELVVRGDFRRVQSWTDERQHFEVLYLEGV